MNPSGLCTVNMVMAERVAMAFSRDCIHKSGYFNSAFNVVLVLYFND